jgi:hypothetical protein
MFCLPKLAHLHLACELKTVHSFGNTGLGRTEVQNHASLTIPTQCRIQEVEGLVSTLLFNGSKYINKTAQTLIDCHGFLLSMICHI